MDTKNKQSRNYFWPVVLLTLLLSLLIPPVGVAQAQGPSQSIPLTTGWNLVSFYLHPANTNVAVVLNSLSGKFDLVYAWDSSGGHSGSGNWLIYDPSGPAYANTLATLDETMGFWIKMNTAATLVVEGAIPSSSTTPISTAAGGWNLTGYPCAANQVLPNALSDHGVGSDFSLVYAYHSNDTGDPWKLFDRLGPVFANDLLEMSTGWGYWIKASANHAWSLDCLAPALTITGATADSVPMAGDLATGYILPTTNVPTIDHLVQFAPGTVASETLQNTFFGLKLVASTVSPADLKAYYTARGVPEPFLTYLKNAADGINPFVYIQGSTVKLVDAAKHDILATNVDMTIPDDFPLGTFTVEGKISDLAGNQTTVTLILQVTGDRIDPILTITGATDNGTPMGGNWADGYILPTTNTSSDHLLQFAAGTHASEALQPTYFGLKLIATTVSPADLKAYYAAKPVPEPFLSYLNDAADGIKPFVYINGSTVKLVDAAKHDLLGGADVDMTVPDSFPLGTYTVQGVIKDVAGNETIVTLILKVTGDRIAPALTITGATADGVPMAGDLATGYILPTTNVPTIDHLVQFAPGTVASETLQNTFFGLKLVATTVSPADLKAYYTARGVPEPFLTYLKNAADGINPFVYIQGSTVKLVDAAKHDILTTNVDMTIPDDFPLGTFTVEGKISDLAGNQTTVTLKLIVTGDRIAPALTITGATADGVPMAGDLATGYILPTTNVPTIDHLVQFASGTVASEPLANQFFGLKLVASTVSPADLKAYYTARAVPEPFLTYLKNAADGINPFVYIQGTTVKLVDAAKHDLGAGDVDMTIPDDFPLGTFTVEGKISDLAGNQTTVTLKLVVTGDRVGPTLNITGATDNGDPMAGDLATGYILSTTSHPAFDHLVQFAAGTNTNEPLANEYYGLKLVASTVSAADLKAYYTARGVPEPFLTYLKNAADGINPFVYIKGSTVTLVDAAKHDIRAADVDMTIPDDFPLGTYTVEGKIRDMLGNETTVTLILIVSGDRIAPVLYISGATADGAPMAGDLATGYILPTTNNPALNHDLQFAAGTYASEPLGNTYFGLKLIASTVSPADLKAYYVARGVTEPYLTYLMDAADGANPFVYIKGSTVRLVDAAMHDLGSVDVDMVVPDNYPLGTYTVQGVVRDVAWNETTVTLILKVTGDRIAPTLTITGATDNDTPMGGDLASGYILSTLNDPDFDHLVQFAPGTVASETLQNTFFGLKLVATTVSPADLKAYYAAKPVPEPFLTYLNDAADGIKPFVYINGSTVKLVDAAKHDLLGGATST